MVAAAPRDALINGLACQHHAHAVALVHPAHLTLIDVDMHVKRGTACIEREPREEDALRRGVREVSIVNRAKTTQGTGVQVFMFRQFPIDFLVNTGVQFEEQMLEGFF